MDAGRLRLQRCLEIGDRRQRLVLHDDIGRGVLGQVAALGNDQGHSLAAVADLVLGERHLGALVEHDIVDRRRRDEQWPRTPVVAEINGGVDGDHAGAPARLGGVNLDQPRMSVRAANEGGVQHLRQLDVVDEQRLAGEQTAVFVAGDSRADIRRRPRLARFGERVWQERVGAGARRALHRIDDVLVSGAAAQVAGQRRADLVLRRCAIRGQKLPHRHQNPRRAEAALQRMRIAKRLLQRMQPLAVARRDSPLSRSRARWPAPRASGTTARAGRRAGPCRRRTRHARSRHGCR